MQLLYARVQSDDHAARRARISDINAAFAGGDAAKALHKALED